MSGGQMLQSNTPLALPDPLVVNRDLPQCATHGIDVVEFFFYYSLGQPLIDSCQVLERSHPMAFVRVHFAFPREDSVWLGTGKLDRLAPPIDFFGRLKVRLALFS